VFVNVGLFAQAGNASQAHARLLAAGLPAVSDQINNAQGQQRTRVRAGPFASRAQAQAAIGQIKALQLEAVLAP
jgi:cell division septation protein DedD